MCVCEKKRKKEEERETTSRTPNLTKRVSMWVGVCVCARVCVGERKRTNEEERERKEAPQSY